MKCASAAAPSLSNEYPEIRDQLLQAWQRFDQSLLPYPTREGDRPDQPEDGFAD